MKVQYAIFTSGITNGQMQVIQILQERERENTSWLLFERQKYEELVVRDFVLRKRLNAKKLLFWVLLINNNIILIWQCIVLNRRTVKIVVFILFVQWNWLCLYCLLFILCVRKHQPTNNLSARQTYKTSLSHTALFFPIHWRNYGINLITFRPFPSAYLAASPFLQGENNR